MRYSVDPAGLQATLAGVAADGESLHQAAATTRGMGDTVAGAFGTAELVAEAFSRFWGARDDVGERVASLVFRKAGAVTDAAHAFVNADGEMASAALGRMPAAYSITGPGSFSGAGVRTVR